MSDEGREKSDLGRSIRQHGEWLAEAVADLADAVRGLWGGAGLRDLAAAAERIALALERQAAATEAMTAALAEREGEG